MATNEDVVARLDRVTALLQLAYREQIARARDEVLADKVNAALLKATASKYIAAGELKTKVAKSTKQSEKTVQRRIQDLVSLGALEVRPTGHAAYRSTGLL
jgi:hypothetical protein